MVSQLLFKINPNDCLKLFMTMTNYTQIRYRNYLALTTLHGMKYTQIEKLLQKLDHNIKTLEAKLTNLQKDVQTLISDQNFFITLFQLRSRINIVQLALKELE